MHYSERYLRALAAVSLVPAFVVGCGGGAMSPAKAATAAVASAAGSSLTGATLERWLLKSPVRPTKLEANVVLSAWINDALIIDAVHHKASLDDSVVVDSVIRPDAERGVTVAYMVQRDNKLPAVTEAEVDSLLDIDRVRVFQQVLIRADPPNDSATVMAALQRARTALTRLHAGTDFTTLVRQASEDSASKHTDGFLPAVSRDQLPDRLAAIWRLRPGETSTLIPSEAGFHIVRRATRAESRTGIKTWLRPVLAHRADSVFIDSLSAAAHIVVLPDARLRTRSMALEPNPLSSGGPVVTWANNGGLAAAEVREHILMMPPAERFSLSGASDSLVSSYLIDEAKRKILLNFITTNPMPSVEARQAMAPTYHLAIDSIRAIIGRMPASANAGADASDYIDSMLAGTRRHLALPGALGAVLRTRQAPSIDQSALAGVLEGVSIKWQEMHKNDSTPTPGKPRPSTAAKVPGPPK